jgi:hypothetical protein
MLRLKAVSERQVLIEEIYDELEGLLLQAQDASVDEEEDAQDAIGFPDSLHKGPGGQTRAAKRTARPHTKEDFSDLLTELLRSQKMLQRGLDRLGKLLEQQS